MRRFVTLNCLIDCNDTSVLHSSDAIQNLRQAVLCPALYRPSIQQALKSANFKFHRTCSYASIIQECNVGEGQTLLMFWGYAARSESRITSMSASNSSSVHMLSPQNSTMRERELRTVGQQTEISCRLNPANPMPITGNLPESEELMRVPFSSPASSLLQPPRSTSILGSVCALLLNKQQGSALTAKEVPSYTGTANTNASNPLDTNICRICFGGESAERLVRPCSCRGTIAAVHRSCLERWLLQAATSYCELCRHHYVVTRSHKWSWLMSLAAWAVSGRGRALAADAWRGAALGACSVLGTARALHACDVVLQAGARRGGTAALAANLFSSLLIGVIGVVLWLCIGALNGLLTTWMLLKIQEHQLSWQAWRDSTLHVHVTLDDDEPHTPHPSDVTVVAANASQTTDRSTNIADPFMVAPFPFTLPESSPTP